MIPDKDTTGKPVIPQAMPMEVKKLYRRVQLIELRYKWACEDGRKVDAARMLKKAMSIGKRLGELFAILRMPVPKELKELLG